MSSSQHPRGLEQIDLEIDQSRRAPSGPSSRRTNPPNARDPITGKKPDRPFKGLRALEPWSSTSHPPVRVIRQLVCCDAGVVHTPLTDQPRPLPTAHAEGYVLYMGKDKYENEDLIRYGLPEDGPCACE